ncbi:predicted protein [Naegleria gruberi]|uniref:Predicted protein n=1 Tax=Naegleria gruberi TaxID=5762 RepID=D2VDF2_NAEGR|nr:uncharacterized protein NAEGRDRAFT_48598 [Naegleria gruberi]EFC45223.1 predicted protein [Naegleria gruberi]|eukprot:XP_002677967.1 predicted protein [Naegleria gruberi strain NEG-M]
MDTSPRIILNNIKHYLFNRDDVICPSHLINELFEFVFVVTLYPAVSFLNLMVQFFRFFYQLTLSVSEQTPTLDSNSILITGASCGIGLSLAKSICNQWLIQKRTKLGQVSNEKKTLTLVSRNLDKLERVREEIYSTFSSRNLKELVDIQVRDCDICDRKEIEKVVTEQDYDMVIASAATNSQILSREFSSQNGGKTDKKGENIQDEEDVIYQEFQVNIFGTLNTVLPAMKQAKNRNIDSRLPKHVVVVASGAGYHGKLMGPYGITKTFLFEFSRMFQFILNNNDNQNQHENNLDYSSSDVVRNFKEMSRKYANQKQLVLHVVNPAGVTDTRMGETIKNLDKIPGSIHSNHAANLILGGLIKNERVIDLNNSFVYAGLRFLNALPVSAESFVTNCLNLQIYS